MEEEIVNYAFISYKRIEPDETWAKNLHRLLNSWHIPTNIAYSERLNNNKRISPIVRDKDDFPPGNGLDETIKMALRQSRSMILILSKAMIEDQMARRSKGEHAYIFEEIEYFQSLEHSQQSINSLEHSQRLIIPVYIDSGNQNPSELLPPMLKGYDKLIVNINDYIEYLQASEKQWFKRVAAAVASGIFQKDQSFFWNYYLKAVRKLRIKIAVIVSLALFIFIGLLLKVNQQRVRTRIAESYGLIEQSRQARKVHDTQAALIFALEAYEKSPDLDAALSNLRQQAIPNEQEPRTFLRNSIAAISHDAQKVAVYDHDLRTIKLLRTRDLSEIETIGRSFITVWQISFSRNSDKIGILGLDSLWIYDCIMHKYTYAERHPKFLHGPIRRHGYHSFFTPQDSYFIQILNDCIVRLNIETEHVDTLNVSSYVNGVQQVGDDVFLGMSDSAGMGIYRLDYERFKLTSVFTIPIYTNGNWSFHAESTQIAYRINDSIYRESPRNKIFCGTGTIGSFEPNGNHLLWRGNKYIGLTDSVGFTSIKKIYGEENNLNNIQWINNEELLLFYNDYLQIINVSSSSQEKHKLIMPKGSVSAHDDAKIYLSDSLLFLFPINFVGLRDVKFLIYNYSTIKDNSCDKNVSYVLDGQMYLQKRNNEVVCTRRQDDSIIWHIVTYPAGSSTNKGWISPNRKRCALAHHLYYDEKYRVCIAGLKIVDIASGKVLFEKDSAIFNRFMSDDIFVYKKRDSVFIADIETKHALFWGKDDNMHLDKWLQIGFRCAEDSDGTCVITNSSGVQVYDFSARKQLLNIPLSVDVESIVLDLCPQGNYLFIGQMYGNKEDERNGYSRISIWDIPNKKQALQKELCELYFDGIMTKKGYLILRAWDRITIYNYQSKKYISTIHLGMLPWSVIELPNGNILLGATNGRAFEIDPKRGKIVEEKEYPDGIEEKILGGHYIMSGNSLIDLNTDKIVLQLNKNEDNNTRDYVISIQDSIMLIDRTIDNRESREMIIPFEDEEALVRRVRQIVGQRILSPHERAQYRE